MHHVIHFPTVMRYCKIGSSNVRCNYSSHSGFSLGESVLLTDAKRRQYLVRLKEGGCFQYHAGTVMHNLILATPNGGSVTSTKGLKLIARHPLLWEYTLLMPRGPTPSYPKDIWSILGLLDVSPGQRVLEAGSGSGALTLHLSRAVGACGVVHSFEQSPEHLAVARSNVATWNSTQDLPDNIHFVQDNIANVAAHCITQSMDAAVLDLVDPSLVVEQVLAVLRPGAPLVAYLPNVSQIMKLCTVTGALDRVMEVVLRDWTVRPANTSTANQQHFIARPSHVQEPHSGFLAVLRRKP